MIEERIRRNVIRERTKRHWLQLELARRAGINHSTISYLEAGKRSVSVRNLEKIADAFGISIQSITK